MGERGGGGGMAEAIGDKEDKRVAGCQQGRNGRKGAPSIYNKVSFLTSCTTQWGPSHRRQLQSLLFP